RTVELLDLSTTIFSIRDSQLRSYPRTRLPPLCSPSVRCSTIESPPYRNQSQIVFSVSFAWAMAWIGLLQRLSVRVRGDSFPDCRQPLPWDFLRFARRPPTICMRRGAKNRRQ